MVTVSFIACFFTHYLLFCTLQSYNYTFNFMVKEWPKQDHNDDQLDVTRMNDATDNNELDTDSNVLFHIVQAHLPKGLRKIG